MKSKIRIEYDFDKKEPYLEIRLPAYPKLAIADKPDSGILPDESPDLRDSMLKNFIQEIDSRLNDLVLQYPEKNTDNSVARIYLQKKIFDIQTPYIFLLPDGTAIHGYINLLNATKGILSFSPIFYQEPPRIGPQTGEGPEDQWETIHHPETSAYKDVRFEWNEERMKAKVIYKD